MNATVGADSEGGLQGPAHLSLRLNRPLRHVTLLAQLEELTKEVILIFVILRLC